MGYTFPMPMKNRFPGKCASCKVDVPAGEGFAIRRPAGWVAACRSTACLRQLNVDVDAAQNGKTHSGSVDENGCVRFPYNPDRVAIVRTMPGARWNHEGKHWTVSTATKDLPRLIKLAERAKLDIPDSFRQRAAEGTVESREADRRAAREGLYEFQREGVRFLSLHDRALLADGMGAGKTVQTLVALPDHGRVLVVCPAVVKFNWQAEANKWRGDYRVTVLSGRKSFRLPEPGEIVIVNYDILPTTAPDTTGLTVILDEAHTCKNRKAKRTKICTAICKSADRVWLLSGTPMTNKPFDLLSVLKTAGIDQSVFSSFSNFLKLFGAVPGEWGGYEFGEVSPEVGERLRSVMIRRTLEEVLPDLPSFRYQRIDVDAMNAKVKRALDKIGEDFEDSLREGVLPPFNEMSAVRAAIAELRIPQMLSIVEQYEEADEPLVVFSAHRAPIDELNGREGWATITGDTSASDRTEIVQRFQAGELKGVGLTIGAGGGGITLTHASTTLFVDRSWTPADNCQAEDRVRRIGQEAAGLLCVTLTSQHPVDRRVEQLLEKKIRRFRDTMESRMKAVELPQTGAVDLVEETDEQLQERLAAAQEAAEAAERSFWLDKVGEKLAERQRVNGEGSGIELTDEVKAAIREAFDYMIGRCDGAIERDGMGFNKPDAAVMHWINNAGGFSTDATYRFVEMTLRTYKRQLSGFQIWRERRTDDESR